MRSRLSSIWGWLPLLLLAALVPIYVCYLLQPAFGYFHDDGVYIVNALSLISGSGYRTISLPTPLFQTKYPILYPAVLSLLWKVFPAFPQNVFTFKFLSLVSGLLWAGAAFLAVRRETASTAIARWSVLFTLAAPWTIFLSTSVLPDTLFALLSVCAILILANQPENHRSVAMAAVIAGCAFLLRSVGVALILAACLFLLQKRRFRGAVLFLAVSGALVLPWIIWQSAHAASADNVESYYTKLSYAAGNIFHYPISDSLVAVGFNFSVILGTVCPVAGAPLLSLQMIANLLAGLLVLVALLSSRRWSLPVIWAVVYCAVLLCWVAPAPRYLTPVLPFAFMLLFATIEKLLAKVRNGRLKGFAEAGLLTAALGCVIANAASLRYVTHLTIQNKTPAFSIAKPDDWSKTLELAQWLQTRTPVNAIIGANGDPAFYLLTHRFAIRPFNADPFQLFYDQRPAKEPLGSVDRLRCHLKTHHIDYIVITPMDSYPEKASFERQLFGLIRAYPLAFEREMQTSDPNYYILRVDTKIL